MEEKIASPVIPAKAGIQRWGDGTGFPFGSGMTGKLKMRRNEIGVGEHLCVLPTRADREGT